MGNHCNDDVIIFAQLEEFPSCVMDNDLRRILTASLTRWETKHGIMLLYHQFPKLVLLKMSPTYICHFQIIQIVQKICGKTLSTPCIA